MEPTRLCRMATEGVYWLVIYAALWALFTEGQGWLLGVPSVTVAAAVSVGLGLRPVHVRWRALPGFIGFFLVNVCRGAWDVACRALLPRRPVAPAWVDYRLQYCEPRVGLMLSALVGLVPGTLSSQVDGRLMRVHVLDIRHPWEGTVAELERRLAVLLDAEGRP